MTGTEIVEVERLVSESKLEKTKAQKVLDNFTDFFEEASTWESQVKDLVITDASQVEEMQLARRARLALQKVRTNAEKVKKELKENVLIEGRFIDGIYNTVVGVTKPLENELLEKEKFVERIEQAKIEAIREEREVKLLQYDVDASCFDLASMADAAFLQLLEGSRIAHEQKIEAERKAEEERIAKEQAEAAERERIRLENEQLKKEAEAKERELAKERAKQEAERIEREKKEAAEKLKREKAEAEERAKQEAILQKEREEKAAIVAEMKAKQEAETRERQEREAKEAAELQAKEAAEKAAALAPDKTKFTAFCDSLLSVQRPTITDKGIRETLDKIVQLINEYKTKVNK